MPMLLFSEGTNSCATYGNFSLSVCCDDPDGCVAAATVVQVRINLNNQLRGPYLDA